MNTLSHRYRRHVLTGSAALVVASSMRSACAQAPMGWASRPIRLLVGFPPGGLIDAYARLYAEQLISATTRPVLVENRPGASGMLALEVLARSAPDGHTLAMSTSSALLQNRILYRKLPYDPDRDFQPVSLFPGGPLVFAASASVTARSVAELLDVSRSVPIVCGTYGPGSQAHMVVDSFKRQYGARIEAIHYKGESPMWVDLGAGAIQLAIGSFQGYRPVAAKGLARALAVTGSHRSAKLPEVPTLNQAGLTARVMSLDVWGPLLAPAGTPEAVLAALASVAVEGAESPKAVQLREAYGISQGPTSLDETRRRWSRDGPQWIEVARSLGITLD